MANRTQETEKLVAENIESNKRIYTDCQWCVHWHYGICQVHHCLVDGNESCHDFMGFDEI